MKARRRGRERKCRHCGTWFIPDARAGKRHRFCGKRECQKARRRRTSRAWRRHNHLSHESDVVRVRVWRANHPKYWRRHRRRWLITELLVPMVRLRRTRLWVKLSLPKTGALRILNLVQVPGQPCVLRNLLSALRIPIGQKTCHCYLSPRSKDCPMAQPARTAGKRAGRPVLGNQRCWKQKHRKSGRKSYLPRRKQVTCRTPHSRRASSRK